MTLEALAAHVANDKRNLEYALTPQGHAKLALVLADCAMTLEDAEELLGLQPGEPRPLFADAAANFDRAVAAYRKTMFGR